VMVLQQGEMLYENEYQSCQHGQSFCYNYLNLRPGGGNSGLALPADSIDVANGRPEIIKSVRDASGATHPGVKSPTTVASIGASVMVANYSANGTLPRARVRRVIITTEPRAPSREAASAILSRVIWTGIDFIAAGGSGVILTSL
jgi:hypothetical protein